MTPISRLTANWWASLSKLKADVAAANGNEAALAVACEAERIRAEVLLQAIEDAGGMTPTEAVGLLHLSLVLSADQRRDHLFRLLSALRDGLAPRT